MHVIGQLYDEHYIITQWIWNQKNNTTQKTKDWSTFKTRDELRCSMWFLLLCRIENSMTIAGLLGIIRYDNRFMTLWAKSVGMTDRSINWLVTQNVTNSFWCIYIWKLMVYLCIYWFVFNILACVRVYCILYNLLLLLYYLTFQETIKNQLKGNYRVMVFNGTFNNSSVISWQSVVLVAETGGPENHQPAVSHNVSSTPSLSMIRTHNVSDGHWLHR